MNLRFPLSFAFNCITACAVVAEPEKKSIIIGSPIHSSRLESCVTNVQKWFINSTGFAKSKNISNNITIQDLNTPALYLNSDKESIIKGETTLLITSFSIPQENETIYLNKIIDNENLTLELTSTNSGLNHEIKTKVTDENDNGLENIRIKLYKEEW